MIPASWQLPREIYVDDPELAFKCKRSRDYEDRCWWFVQGTCLRDTWFVEKNRNANEHKDRYYQTEYAAREAAAVLNLEVAVHRRLQEVARGAQDQTISRGEAQDGCSP